MKLRNKAAVLAITIVTAASAMTAVPVMAATTNQASRSAAQNAAGERKERKDPFSDLVEKGTISQETSDKIKAYLKENMPERKSGAGSTGNAGSSTAGTADGTKRPEKKKRTDGTDGTTSTAKPEKSENASGSTGEAGAEAGKGGQHRGGRGYGMLSQDMLDKLLADKVITQAEYNALKEALPAAQEKPADGQRPQRGTKKSGSATGTT